MSSFLSSVKSETTKLLTLRSTLIYFILLGGSIGGPVFLYLLLSETPLKVDFSDVGIGGMIALMICIVFGASTTAGEISTKMHAQAFLTQQSRWNWLAARGLVASVFVVFTLALAMALTVLMIVIWPGATFVGEQNNTVWSLLIGGAAFTLLALGTASLLRSRVAGIGVPLVWMLVVEPLISLGGEKFDILKKLSDVMPANTINEIQRYYTLEGYGALMEGAHTPAFYLTVLAVWVVALLILGFYRNSRTDVR